MNKLAFQVPEGMQLPDGVKEGDEFDALATVKMGPSGKLMLVAVDGYSLAEAKEDEPKSAEEDDDEPQFADVVARGMGYQS